MSRHGIWTNGRRRHQICNSRRSRQRHPLLAFTARRTPQSPRGDGGVRRVGHAKRRVETPFVAAEVLYKFACVLPVFEDDTTGYKVPRSIVPGSPGSATLHLVLFLESILTIRRTPLASADIILLYFYRSGATLVPNVAADDMILSIFFYLYHLFI